MSFEPQSHLNHRAHLFPDCVAVRGANRSAIYDLTRGDIIVFGSGYLEVLSALMRYRLDYVLKAAGESGKLSDCMKFLNLLWDSEFIFFAARAGCESKMPEERRTACRVENAIVDCFEIVHNFKSILEQLNILGCQFIEIRCFSTILTPPAIRSLLCHAYDTSIRGVELILKSDPNYREQDYIRLLEAEPIITRLTVHSSPNAKQVSIDLGDQYLSTKKRLAQVYFVKQEITSELHCGIISEGSLSKPTPAAFFINKTANGCLSRKVSIDATGRVSRT